MNNQPTGKTLKSDLLLLLTAAIWGFAFVAQRVGMDYIGPYLFNGIRFLLGASVLLPLILLKKQHTDHRLLLKAGLTSGLLLFFGSSLQQLGITTTTAGNAGFITGIYVVIVPFLGLMLYKKPNTANLFGALLAIIGLYLLTNTSSLLSINLGDLYVLLGAFFWAAHVHSIGLYSPKLNPLRLAFVQYLICSLLSLFVALLIEPINSQAISQATLPILYGGIMSVGIAYSLQVVAQQHSPPTHSAIILSLESVFAAIGGILLLHEAWSPTTLLGAALMLLAVFISQLQKPSKKQRQLYT